MARRPLSGSRSVASAGATQRAVGVGGTSAASLERSHCPVARSSGTLPFSPTMNSASAEAIQSSPLGVSSADSTTAGVRRRETSRNASNASRRTTCWAATTHTVPDAGSTCMPRTISPSSRPSVRRVRTMPSLSSSRSDPPAATHNAAGPAAASASMGAGNDTTATRASVASKRVSSPPCASHMPPMPSLARRVARSQEAARDTCVSCGSLARLRINRVSCTRHVASGSSSAAHTARTGSDAGSGASRTWPSALDTHRAAASAPAAPSCTRRPG